MTDYVYKPIVSATAVAERIGVTGRLTGLPSIAVTTDEYHVREVTISLPGVVLSDAEKTTLQDIAKAMNWGYLESQP